MPVIPQVLPVPPPTTSPTESRTALDIIKSAMRLINVLSSGSTPSGAEAEDARVILNEMVDSWNAEELMIFTTQRIVNDINNNPFTLTPGQQVYKVGIGGDFNIQRPPALPRIGLISLLNPAQPLELPLEMLDDAGWQAIPVKNILSTIPLKVWDDKSFPYRNLSFWCIPSIPQQVALYAEQALNQFPDLVTSFMFPPGYFKALRYNLAVDLAPEFGRPLPPEVAAQAISAKAVVKSFNSSPPEMRCDQALVDPNAVVYDWRSDEPAGY